MRALAELLVGLGWRVTGSDLAASGSAVDAMNRMGLRVHSGHDEQFLPQDTDVVIYSPAVGPSNPERRLAEKLNIRTFSYTQMLGWLMQQRTGVAVAGTHGKSTTTAMVSTILGDSELEPSAVFGAELCGCRRSGWAGAGDLLVVESCEYQRGFLELQPKYAAILGIEPDHFDYYPHFEDTCAAFAEFAAKVAFDGAIIVRGDCRAAIEAANCSAAEPITFSMKPGSDWWATDLRRCGSEQYFRVFHRGEFFSEIYLPIPGEHNVLNALAAAALCHRVGAPPDAIRESLAEFPGISRRFEHVGSWRGVTMIDDYAHHPTAVQATLRAARESFGARRVCCVFQPHQRSRTRALMTEFAASFGAADRVLIAPVFSAREEDDAANREIAAELAGLIAEKGVIASACDSLDRVIATLDDESRPGDVLVTMGAGDIDRVHHAFTGRLQKHHAIR